MGTQKFTLAFYSDADLVRDMMDYQATFIIESMREAVQALGCSIDFVVIDEDMAYKHGPFVSPKLFKEFILPGYKRVTAFLRENGIKNIFVDTDGNITPLIQLLLEGGVNGLLPLEVTAGMDAVSLRREYGRSLKLIGNLDKRALTKDPVAIQREIESKVPYLKEEGGYIPMLDHVIPADIPFENFRHYSECLKTFL
jgi:uroporphyrinogen decarboxylase